MVRRKRLWKRLAAVLCVTAGVLLHSFPATAEEIREPEQLYAQSAVLMDADSGRILFAKNGQEQRAMASTTKIMTCILTIENADLTEWAEASADAASQPEVHLGVRKGQQFQVKDLLYSLMLESHNDAAVILAEHVGGSVKGFAGMMNEKAKEIGCENTYFITPNGLDAADEYGSHHTTAQDLARIMKYCIRDSSARETFLEITQTQSYTFADRDGTRNYSCQNHNAFLKMMEGALSGKTGFTNEAGYCYVGALEKDGKCLIVALLACGWPNNKSYKWRDTRELMEYGLKTFEFVSLPPEPELPSLAVENGVASQTMPNAPAYVKIKCADSPEAVRALLRKDWEIERETEIEEKLCAPVKKGTVVGKVRYLCQGNLLYESEIVTCHEVKLRDLRWCMRWMLREMSLAK